MPVPCFPFQQYKSRLEDSQSGLVFGKRGRWCAFSSPEKAAPVASTEQNASEWLPTAQWPSGPRAIYLANEWVMSAGNEWEPSWGLEPRVSRVPDRPGHRAPDRPASTQPGAQVSGFIHSPFCQSGCTCQQSCQMMITGFSASELVVVSCTYCLYNLQAMYWLPGCHWYLTFDLCFGMFLFWQLLLSDSCLVMTLFVQQTYIIYAGNIKHLTIPWKSCYTVALL